jgi:ATP-binding cassette, subfamily B, bacterial PglK
MNNKSISENIALIKQMYGFISKRRRTQLKLLLILTLLGAVAEIVSIGAIVPFIGVLTQPEVIFDYPFISKIIIFFGIQDTSELVIFLAIAFIVAALVSGFMRLLLLWATIIFVNATAADISILVYRNVIYQPYEVHISRNSSEIIAVITQKVAAVSAVLLSTVTIITSIILLVFILSMLIYIDPIVSTIAIVSFVSIYFLIILMTRRKVFLNGREIAYEQTKIVKLLQEGIGAVRDILIDRNQEMYIDLYGNSIRKLQFKNTSNSFISQAPRFALEAFGMALIGLLVLLLNSFDNGIGGALPTLAALAIGAQRMLPLLQLLYGNWMVVIGRSPAMQDAFNILNQSAPQINSPLEGTIFEFNNDITFKNVFYRYSKTTQWVLKDINLIIKKGSRVGVIGSTGGGKSTTLDLLLGLLPPTKGDICVDGKSIVNNNILMSFWHNKISHVPQNIFLIDNTITKNIAFGIPDKEVDHERVKFVASQANLIDFIESSSNGFETIIGERGVMLSGGQRQRIAIARALYKGAEVLIFDEATSALDNKTEEKIMNSIYGLSKNITIIMIAHRLSSLKGCDKIIQIENNKVLWEGTYDKVKL